MNEVPFFIEGSEHLKSIFILMETFFVSPPIQNKVSKTSPKIVKV